MLSKGKVALQSLAERIRERGLGEVPQGWCKKLGQLVKAVDKKTQALEDWWKYTISEPAKRDAFGSSNQSGLTESSGCSFTSSSFFILWEVNYAVVLETVGKSWSL